MGKGWGTGKCLAEWELGKSWVSTSATPLANHWAWGAVSCLNVHPGRSGPGERWDLRTNTQTQHLDGNAGARWLDAVFDRGNGFHVWSLTHICCSFCPCVHVWPEPENRVCRGEVCISRLRAHVTWYASEFGSLWGVRSDSSCHFLHCAFTLPSHSVRLNLTLRAHTHRSYYAFTCHSSVCKDSGLLL